MMLKELKYSSSKPSMRITHLMGFIKDDKVEGIVIKDFKVSPSTKCLIV